LIAQKEYEAILFDMDGVFILSGGSQYRAWTWWCRIHNLPPEPFLDAHGMTGADKIRMFAPSHLDPVMEADRVTNYEVRDTKGVIAAPGAELVPGLRLPFSLVTSAADRLARARLTAAGLPIPRHVISAESVARAKPDPEPYLLGAAVLGVDPGKCLVVEDAVAGVQAGRAAGMHVAALTTTVGQEDLSGADLIFPSLMGLLSWLSDS
jgi:mannitol-1-/sugar-/sorbitol-6-phosphatase